MKLTFEEIELIISSLDSSSTYIHRRIEKDKYNKNKKPTQQDLDRIQEYEALIKKFKDMCLDFSVSSKE